MAKIADCCQREAPNSEPTMDWYNGYSPQERAAMGRASFPAFARQPPCRMCGDPSPAVMETHAEDYARPYRWEAPAAYPLCRVCHRRLHARFNSPENWGAFLQFLRRGWYGREVPASEIKRLLALRGAYPWPALPHSPPIREDAGTFWWERLTLDKSTLVSPAARLR
jgi:hypothetical protein